MLRRTFLLGTAAALAARSQKSGEDSGGLGSLAYVQNGTLWIKRLPDGSPRALAAGSAVYEPKFSASGRWIVFRDGDDLLRLVSADGKRAKSWAAAGQWLPGRNELAVYLGEGGNQTVVFGESDDRNSPIRTFSDPLGTISADGGLRAWESSTGDRKQLFAGPFAEPGEPKLIAETGQGGFQVFDFARSGSRFLYWMTGEDGADAWSYGLDFYMAGGSQPVKTGVSTLVNGDEWNMISLSPVANMLAAAIGDDHLSYQDHSIVLVDISADSNIPVHPITGPLVSAIDPVWSPDGRQLVWSQGPDAHALDKQLSAIGQNLTGDELALRSLRQRRIWSAGDRGLGAQTQLTNDARYYDETPLWSRDGSHILFGRRDAQETKTLWLMLADGSDAREVAGPVMRQSDPFILPWRSVFDWSYR